MAEAFERFKRFEYRQNSNLVLQRDPYLTGAPGGAHQGEPTGEPETLAGRKLYPMGDKAERGLKKEEKEKIGKRRSKIKEGGGAKRAKMVRKNRLPARVAVETSMKASISKLNFCAICASTKPPAALLSRLGDIFDNSILSEDHCVLCFTGHAVD